MGKVCKICQFEIDDFEVGGHSPSCSKYKPKKIEEFMPEKEWEWKKTLDEYTEWFNSYFSPPSLSSHLGFWTRKLKAQQKGIQRLIAEEICIAQKEGMPTSRLTSLSVKISELRI